MADYGHELVFGTFITPQNADPQAPVALAVLSEQAGLDLVTFQDHPYQPAFLDTWTLLSYVAARTSKVKLSGNVLNLPLRVPAHLARQAASLDLLSGGRFELGLGAGGFWDAIEAMGGPRRTPGEAVEALSEAIEVIRATWDASARGGVFTSGVHYRVRGGKRGPEPAHDIGIWLGAYKPRMLRLIGAKADGWLPSLSYLKPGDLERGNATIDEAAAQAGRDPREIRRLLNIGPQDATLDTLLPLVLEQGISTFILAADDPRTIQAWGQEIAPALREAVAEEREGVVRDPKAPARRRDGIDYDAVPSALKANAVEPGDKAYPKVRSTYFRHGSPGLVLRPGTAAEVAAALTYARSQKGPLAVRSGGHGISGRSTNDGGIVIDLGRLGGIEVTGTTVRVGSGTTWGHLAESLAPFGLAMSSGDYGGVGVGGLATAGGIGLLGRWGKLVEAAPRELTSFLYLSAARRGQPPLAHAIAVYACDDADAAVAALTPLLSIAPILQQQAHLVPYAAIVPPADATHHGGQESVLFSNGFAEHLDDEINEIIADGLHGAAPWTAIRAVGGAVNDVDPAATAYAHRHQNFNVSSTGFDPTRFRAHWDDLRPHLDGLYLSFETDTRPERLHDAFPALARLRELKTRYDPDNVFNQNFPITSAVSRGGGTAGEGRGGAS